MNLTKNLIIVVSRIPHSLVIGIATFLLSTSILANPVVDNVAAGQVTIQQTPNSTVVNQSSSQAIINWQSFNIGAQETTHFQQPAGGVALNRINPSNGVSAIYGRLTATGQIILVNPAGLFFGPGSFVNVGGLVASTANITDQDFLNGYYSFANTPGFNGAIVNQGQIIAADNGLVALIGGAVSNEGMIQANMGQVVLASGNAATMTFAGNNLISFTVDSGVTQRARDKNGKELKDGVSNTGSLIANGGRILIAAKDAAGILDRVINLEGFARTISVSDGAQPNDGEIILLGDNNRGVVRVAGNIDASGKRDNQHGGSITVTGYNILLDNAATLDVRGDVGGGNINIGGNYLGKGPLDNANAVVMNAGTSLYADTLTHGNGGKVIVWSDNYTKVNGHISARGGNESGDGGFIETSGKQTLQVGDITIDTRATNGNIGTWLLDPTNIYIAASQANATTAGMTGTDSSANTGTGVNPMTFGASGAIQDSYLSTGALTTALSSANVIVTTNNDIGIGVGDITVVDTISWNSAFDLRLSAYRNIAVNGAASITNTGSGSIFLNADNMGTGTGGVTFGTGNAQVGAGGSVSIFYSPVTFGAPTALENTPYAGGTTPTSYQLILGLGTDSDASTVRSLGAVSNNDALASQNFALASDIDASATSTWNGGAGFDPIGTGTTTYFTGNFDGQNFGISNLFINRPSESRIGLFASMNGGSVSNLSLINPSILALSIVAGFSSFTFSSQFNNLKVIGGNITGISVCAGSCGGNVAAIAGFASGTNFTNIYNSADIEGRTYVGGIVGYLSGSSTISNAYNTGDVFSNSTQNKYTGGIAGLLNASTPVITNSYNSGRVYALNTSGFIGAIAGWNSSATITNSFWDVDTSQQTTPVGPTSATPSRTYAGCAAGNCSASTSSVSATHLFGGTAFADLTAEATYTTTLTTNGGTAWDITSTPSTTATAPTSAWFIFEGSTRPLLAMEHTTTIRNAHELQMMGAALGGTYTLANDIDFNTISSGDVWGVNFSAIDISNPYAIPSTPAGFHSIGNNTDEFTGSFDGQNNTINGLYINTPSTSYVGLFGQTSTGTTIENITITNPIIYGSSYVSALVGNNQGTIDNSYTTSTTGSPSWIGGALLSNNYDIRAASITGGIAGYSSGSISNSHSKLNILSGYMGGIVGRNAGTVTNSFSSGRSDAGASQVVGGLVGDNTTTGQIINSFNDGSVSMGYYTTIFGGLVGSNAGLISESYNLGRVSVGFGNSSIGGLVGRNLATGTIINSYNLGSIRYGQGTNGNQGGIAGTNAGIITNVYNAGTTYYQHSPTGTNNNGFVGSNTGTINDSFWDMGTSSYTRGYASNSGTINGLYAGCFGNTTCNGATPITGATNAGGTALDLTKVGTYTTNGPTWDMATVWNMIPDQSYPYLRDFYSATPRAVSGYHPSGSRYLGVSIAYNGVVRDSTQTFYNGFAYFLEGNNLVSKVDNTIADGDGILVFTTSGLKANFATYAPSAGASMSGVNGFEFTANTITGANTETITGLITPLTNAQIVAAAGGLSNANIIYSGSGNNITVTSGYSFATTAATPYNLNGTISVTNGNITLNAPVTVTIPSAALTTVSSGNINVYNTINGNNNALTINTVGTTSSVTGVMSNLSSFTKAGSGTLTLSAANAYTSATNVNGGTLSISADNNLGVAPGTATVGHLSFNGGTLQNTSAMALNANRGITLNASGGRLDTASDLTYNGVIAGTGVLTKLGAGSLTLDTAHTYSGGTLLSAGLLSLGHNTAIGYGTLTFNGGSFAVNTNNLVIANNIVLNIAANFASSLDFTLNGLLSGTGGVTQAGSNTVTLGNTASTYTGQTTISSGTLSVATLGNLSSNSSLGRPTTVGNGTIDIGATGILSVTGSGSTSNRVINITGDGATIDASGSGALVLTGGITGADNNLILTGSGLASQSGAITNTLATVTKDGTGTWTLSGTNTYGVAASTIINGGTLAISADANLGVVPIAPDVDNIQLGSGGTLLVDNSGNTVTIDSNRGLVLTAGGGTLKSATNTVAVYDGIIDGAEALTLDGPGSITLGGVIGGVTPPTTLTANANLNILTLNTPTITTTGNQTFNSLITLGTSDVSLMTTVAGGGSVSLAGATWTNGSAFSVDSDVNLTMTGDYTGVSGSSLTLSASSLLQNIAGSAANIIDVTNFNLAKGQWTQIAAVLPTFTVTNFQINSGGAPDSNTSFIRALSGDGSALTPYELTDIYGLQGIHSNPTTLTQNYQLANDINAISTATWNGSLGWVPIGSSAVNFSGNFDGQNYAVINYRIRSQANYLGLFGQTDTAATISNLGVTGLSISTYYSGYLGSTYSGGLVGRNQGTISNVYTTGVMQGRSAVGGITGRNDGTISDSYNSATITTSYSSIGGIAGQNFGTITRSYNTGTVTAFQWGGTAGGIAGSNANGAQITNTFNVGYINAGIYNSVFGGIVGSNAGLVERSYNEGGLGGAISGNFGGVVGVNSATGIINDAYNTGTVGVGSSINNTYFGGFAGINSGQINRSYSIGRVTKPGNTNIIAGFVGSNSGTVSGSFWDTDTSGLSVGVGAGTKTGMIGGCFDASCTNGGTVNLFATNTYSDAGWDMSTKWAIVTEQTFPYLRDFFSNPRIISGTSGTSANTPITISVNGAVVDTVRTFANGYFYRLYDLNNISGISNNLADGSPLLVYQSGNATTGNVLTNLPNANGSLSGATGLTLTTNTVMVGSKGRQIELDNFAARDSKGNLTNSGILYSVDVSGNITIGSGKSFVTTANTVYTLRGDISVTNADIIFNGPTVLTSATSTLTTTGTGSVTILNALNGGGNALVINNADANSMVSGMLGNLSSLTKSGTGTLTLTANNIYTGNTIINGGVLRVGSGSTTGAIGTGSVTNNGSLVFDRSNSYTVVGAVSGTGSVTQQGAGTLIVNGVNTYSGGTNLLAGVISVGNNNGLGTGTLTFNGGSLQAESPGHTISNAVVLAGLGLIHNNGHDFTLSGTIDGGNDLTLTGVGTTRLNGAIGTGTRLASLTANTAVEVNGGSVATTGNQLYNNAVTLGSTTTFDTAGTGTQSIAFNDAINAGVNDLTLTGSSLIGTPTYNFTLNGVTANSVSVMATNNSVNNTLSLNSGSDQNFMLTGNNVGNVDSNICATVGCFSFTNIYNLNGGNAGDNTLTAFNSANNWVINADNGGTVTNLGGSFGNMQNLMGGTDVDTFDFMEGFTIAGMVNGGDMTMNHINFDTFTDNLHLTLNMPIGGVVDAGLIKYSNGTLLANFEFIQQSTGNGLGYITIPNEPSMYVTFYDSTLLNGEIGDPFYFNGWSVGNVPVQPVAAAVSTTVAGIVNQPQTNAEDNDNYSATYSATNYDPTVVNRTYIDPLLDTTTVNAGPACYQINN